MGTDETTRFGGALSETHFFDGMSHERAQRMWKDDPDGVIHGLGLSSVETRADLSRPGILEIVEDRPQEFFDLIRPLPDREWDMLVCYYVRPRACQEALAPLFGVTQTIMSQHIRISLAAAGAIRMFGKPLDHLQSVMREAGLPDRRTVTKAMRIYEQTGLFRKVAMELNTTRGKARRIATRLIEGLDAHGGHRQQAMSAYISLMLMHYFAETHYQTEGKRMRSLDDEVRSDPGWYGDFHIDLSLHPDALERLMPAKADWE